MFEPEETTLVAEEHPILVSNEEVEVHVSDSEMDEEMCGENEVPIFDDDDIMTTTISWRRL